MKLKFSKMHGAGNDFVVIDAVRQRVQLDAAQVRAIADRHFGVGCDQLLLVEASDDPAADFRYRIFNADGGEVEQCGNGARCFARFVHEQGLTDKREIRVVTRSGIIVPRLEDDGRVTVDMGPPRFAPAEIPFDAPARADFYDLDVAGERLAITALSMGNPHAVLRVEDVDTAPVARLGPAIESHPRFPRRVNAGFVQVVDRHRLRLRVYERGAGETLSCGTGACAAAVTAILHGWADSPLNIATRGGLLTLRWAGANSPVLLTGPAVTVFEGTIDLTTLQSLPTLP